jgi:hypothetical protein
MNVGECIHLCNSFICSEGKHQNYPCPYQGDFKKCPRCIVVTEEMHEQWENTGVVRIDLNTRNK